MPQTLYKPGMLTGWSPPKLTKFVSPSLTLFSLFTSIWSAMLSHFINSALCLSIFIVLQVHTLVCCVHFLVCLVKKPEMLLDKQFSPEQVMFNILITSWGIRFKALSACMA